MTQQRQSLRQRRTQTLLRDALVELIEEHGFDTLTVGELTTRAMVSRAAFYRHYQDKYDLVERIFAEAMGPLLAAVNELGGEHPTEAWVRLFEHIGVYHRLYRALLGKNGSPWFARKLRTALAELIDARGQAPHGPDDSIRRAHTFSDGFAPDLVSALFVEAITWWLEQDRPYTPREIATRTALLAAAIFKEAGSWR